MRIIETISRWLGLRAPVSEQPRSPLVVTTEQAVTLAQALHTPRAGLMNALVLRQAADQTMLIRAALNAKRRHVQYLQPAVRGPEEATAARLTAWLAQPAPGMSWRQWVGMVVEDILVLDAACLYVWRRRNGDLYALLPVDAATIAVLQDERGLTPTPPGVAYEQQIMGRAMVGLTTAELIYESLNPRTYSPYGLSPVEVVLYGAYLHYRRLTGHGDLLDSGNVPAFFGELPEGWSTTQIAEFQEFWDAVTKARPQLGRWGPHGANVTFPPRVNEDVTFDEYLTRLICAVLEVQPQELGFTADVNRATGDVQEEITLRRSVRPLAGLLAEVMNQAFRLTGYDEYEFYFPELEERSQAEIRADAQTYIPLGVLTANEVRAELGREPLPDADEFPADEAPETDGRGVSLAGRPGMRRAGTPVAVPDPDSRQTLLEIQEWLRTELLTAAQQVAVAEILARLQEKAGQGPLDDQVVQRIADEVAAAHEAVVRPVLVRALRDMAQDGVAAVGAAFLAAVKITLDWTLANADAANWARRYAGELITGVSDTIKRRVGAEVAAWAESAETFPDLVRRIQAVIGDQQRAELIASTEATTAYAQGNRAAWRQVEQDLGATVVQVWNTAADDNVCEICGPLNQTRARLDEEFAPGIAHPAAHPRCRCWLTEEVLL